MDSDIFAVIILPAVVLFLVVVGHVLDGSGIGYDDWYYHNGENRRGKNGDEE